MEDSVTNGPDIEVTSPDGLPTPSSSDIQAEEELERARRKKRGSFWKRPRTKVYMDNFNFTVNGYQPLIDYLDAKDNGETVNKDVHMPFLEERCMRKYHSTKPFNFYQNSDIDRFISKGEKIRTQIRQNDAAGASSVLRRTHTNWSMTRKYVQLVKKSHVVDHRLLHPEWYTRSGSRSSLSSSPRRSVSVERKSKSPCPKMATVVSSDLINSLAHSKQEHENMMAVRRERLRTLDDQFEDVIQKMSSTVKRMNKSSKNDQINSFDNASSLKDVDNDLVLRNRMRRKHDMESISDGVEDLTCLDSSRNKLRRNLRDLDDEILCMSDNISTMRRRHVEERGSDLGLVGEVARTQADVMSRKSIARRVDEEDYDDADLEYLKRRHIRQPVVEPIDELIIPRKKVREEGSIMSDVHVRILNRASEISGITSEVRHIQNMARFMNPYKRTYPVGYCQGDIKPSRVEINIDHMAKSYATNGKATRKYTVDDEGEPPVSNANTNLIKLYCTRESEAPIQMIPSNSSRVRNAILRARERNSLLRN